MTQNRMFISFLSLTVLLTISSSTMMAGEPAGASVRKDAVGLFHHPKPACFYGVLGGLIGNLSHRLANKMNLSERAQMVTGWATSLAAPFLISVLAQKVNSKNGIDCGDRLMATVLSGLTYQASKTTGPLAIVKLPQPSATVLKHCK